MQLASLISYFVKRTQLCLISLLLLTQTAVAMDGLSIAVDNISTKDWQIKGIRLSLSELQQETQQLVLSIDQMLLTDSLADSSNPELSFVDIQCQNYSWQDNQINCKAGQAKLKSARFQSSSFNFSFLITPEYSQISLQKIKLVKAYLSLKAVDKGGKWSIRLISKGVDIPALYSLLPPEKKALFEIKYGKMQLDARLSGTKKGLNKLDIKSVFNNLQLQAKDGDIATEALTVDFKLKARKKQGVWTWSNNNQLKQGELYIAPVYLSLKKQGLLLNVEGKLNEREELQFHKIKYLHPGVVGINAEAKIGQLSEATLHEARIELKTSQLQPFFSQYIAPYMEQTVFDESDKKEQIKGQLKAKILINQNEIKQGEMIIEHFFLDDLNKHFSIKDATASINWSQDSAFTTASKLSWQQILINGIAINAGQFNFLAKQRSISLLQPSSISLLDGVFDIKRFDWEHQENDEPKVYFEGGIRHLSLEQLSTALQWTPLTGDISGDIPGVVYENKTLSLKGGLTVKIFDGTIKISKLASSGMFKDFSRFYMDMEIDNLDLNEITQKFEIGGMEGRVSGFINKLYLENWKPVSFYAWIGTPEDDDSRHRISQKAVQNIASIGGGGAADVISRGFLRFFDTFGYDKLGFGCYLHQGVCQLMGAEAAEQGYYIIKGGGLPRIDVIAYNPRVDWNVLMERLSRIIESDQVITE